MVVRLEARRGAFTLVRRRLAHRDCGVRGAPPSRMQRGCSALGVLVAE